MNDATLDSQLVAGMAPAESWILILGPWALIWSVVFSANVVRYVVTSGAFALAVERIPSWRRGRIQPRRADESQRRMELRSSLQAGVIFGWQFLPLAYAISAGWTQVYFEASRFGWIYLFASFPLALILHDTYFYWTHRWMHRPEIFRAVHLHHHLSRTPSPWAAFSFHPFESFIQGGIHWLIPLVMPIHVSVLSAVVVWASVYSALIHCGHDVLGSDRPAALLRLRGLLNATLEHDAHHGGAPGNFALYFSFWDRVMGTCVPAVARATHDGASNLCADSNEGVLSSQ